MKGRVLNRAALVLADGGSMATALGDLDGRREVRDGNRTVTFADDVPLGHGSALDPLPASETIRKYGEVIGRTTAAITAGEWVHTHNCRSTRSRGDVAAEVERWPGIHTRTAAESPQTRSRTTADPAERTLVGLIGNPNVAGMVVVGLGCEAIRSDVVTAAVEERGLPVREFTTQDARGTDVCVDRGAAAVTDLRGSAAAQGTDEATVTTDEQTTTPDGFTVGVVVDDLADSTKRHADQLLDAAGRPTRTARIETEAATRGFDAATGFLDNTPATGVTAYGQRADETDAADAAAGAVTLLDTPSRVEGTATGLAATGTHLVLHATRRRTPTGHPIASVVELSGGADTLAAVPNDTNLDAREINADDLKVYLLAVADGGRTCAERHELTEFPIVRAGPPT